MRTEIMAVAVAVITGLAFGSVNRGLSASQADHVLGGDACLEACNEARWWKVQDGLCIQWQVNEAYDGEVSKDEGGTSQVVAGENDFAHYNFMKGAACIGDAYPLEATGCLEVEGTDGTCANTSCEECG